MEKLILLETDKDIALLTINRPEKRNALSPELVDALSKQLIEISNNPAIKAVVITGSGSAFCAGADLAYLKTISQNSDSENLADSKKLADLFAQLYQLNKLTIAMVNGPALAGGFGLALCCDYIFAARETAKFGFTEVRIGFVPALVMNILIRKIAPAVALDLVLSSQIIDAQGALEKQLINKIFPEEILYCETLKFLEQFLTQNSFQAIQATKSLFQKLLDIPLKEGMQLAAEINAQSRKTDDCQNALKAFLNKQTIKWRE